MDDVAPPRPAETSPKNDPVPEDDHRAAPPVPEQFAVVNTHPHKERLVIEHLARQGYQGYCPQLLQRVSHARKVSTVLRPMFPGYLFVALNAQGQLWSPISSTVGVRRIVQFGERPALIEGRFIEALKAREIDGSIIRPAAPYQVGDSIRLVGNAFEGVIANIVQLSGKDRITVLFDLLQRTVKLTTHARHVELVAKAGK
jgi:transcriptional antiterminator RfaH